MNSKSTFNYLYNFLPIVLLPVIIIAAFFVASLNTSFAQSREDLQNELKNLETEILGHKKNIEEKKKEGKSLERDINILDTKIKKTETEIKVTDRNIKNISYDIREKEDNIYTLDKKIKKDREFIKNTLKKMNTDKSDNFVVTILSKDNFSDSVDNLNNLDNLKSSLQSSVQNIRTTKEVIEGVKVQLEDKKEKEEDFKSQKIVLKNEIDQNKQEKKTILTVTKGQEKLYKETLANTEKKASEIRSKLFSFQDGTSVKFGDLYDFAKKASAASGVRTEFILAILEQESGLGKNVGQCYMYNDTGSLKHITNGGERGSMKPDSLQPFLQITSALGRDKFKTKVSCSLSYGYGGAMGISQFMPATWLGFKSQIESATGASNADPWNSAHAIVGTGFLLKQDGASAQTFSAERNAACRYYSGRGCSASGVATGYGNQVMSRIQGIQDKIQVLKNN